MIYIPPGIEVRCDPYLPARKEPRRTILRRWNLCRARFRNSTKPIGDMIYFILKQNGREVVCAAPEVFAAIQRVMPCEQS